MNEFTSLYQLLPDLSTDEYDALKEDIAEHGILVPVEQDDEGQILDGHHRKRIADELGITEVPSVVRTGLTEDQKRDHVLRLNLHRRHLTREQRQEIVSRLRSEGWSTRRIAEKIGVDHSTVVRGLTGGANAPPETVIGADGKSYLANRPPCGNRRAVRAFLSRRSSMLDGTRVM